MENGCSGMNAITGNTENVLSINVAPAEMLNSPPLTLTPYKTEDGFEAFIIHFDEEYEGDLSVKIFIYIRLIILVLLILHMVH